MFQKMSHMHNNLKKVKNSVKIDKQIIVINNAEKGGLGKFSNIFTLATIFLPANTIQYDW